MNIVLTSIHIDRTPDAVPLAPALLKTYLEEKIDNNKVNITVKDFTLKENISDISAKILSSRPDIVGLSIYLWNKYLYIDLVKKLKDLNPNIIIVAGGAEIRSDFEQMINDGVDYTLQGEGEELFYELITSLLSEKNPLEIVGINDNSSRFIEDLNTIPSPLINKNIILNEYEGYLWELSRGCPFSCDFCFESRGSKGVRYYSMDRIEKELDIIVNAGTPQVFVLDPTFNKDVKRAKTILKLIKRKNKGTHFHFEVRAEFLDDELARLFAEVGASLQIGIQSSHDSVLKLINRRINRDKFRQKISLLNKYGAVFGLDLIFGLPGDSYNGFKDSMEYVLSLQPNHLDIFPLAVLPGTALKDNADVLKLKYLKAPPYTVISSNTYSKDDMKKSMLLKEACDFIFNRAKSTGWLGQVCYELKIRQTDFIEKFSNWIKDMKDLISKDEIDVIKVFIKGNFKSKNINLINDMINYHSSYSKALLSKKEKTFVKKKDLLKSCVSLSETATTGSFSYDLLGAFDNGFYTIEDIKKIFRPERNSYISWFHSGGDVQFDCYTDQIMSFIKKIDGKKTPLQIDSRIDPEFLFFAQDTGMLLFN